MAYSETISPGKQHRNVTLLPDFLTGRAKKDKTANPSARAVSIDVNDVLVSQDLGIQTNETGDPMEGNRGTERIVDEKVLVPYENFLKGYARRLSLMKDMPPPEGVTGYNNMFEFVMNSPEHSHDAKLFNEIVDSNGDPDVAKINKLLSTGRGMLLTTAIMDHQRALTMFAMGMVAASDPNGQRMDMAGNGYLLLGRGQGMINRWWNNMDQGQQARLVIGLNATTGGVIAGSLMGGPLGAAIGGAGTAIAGLVSGGLIRSMQEGAAIDLNQCADALRAVRSNPAEVEYIKAMMGVDVLDFRIHNGQIERSSRYSESVALQRSLNEAVQSIYARGEFMTAISGGNADVVDAMPEQYLYDHHGMPGFFQRMFNGRQPRRMPEQVGTQLEERIQMLFRPNDDGIRDLMGRSAVDAAFNPQQLDTVGNLQRYMEARRKAIGELIDGVIQEQLDHEDKVRQERSIDVFDEAIKAREVGGERHKKLQERLEEEKKMLNEVNASLQTEVGTTTDYQDALNNLNAIRQRAEQLLGHSDLTRIDAELRQRGTVDTDRLRVIRDELVQAEAAVANHTVSGEWYDQLSNITSRQLLEAIDPALGIDARLVAAGARAVGIDQNALATLPMDEIMRRMNEAHARGRRRGVAGVGWPPEMNNRPEVRMRVYMQVAEARAREASAIVGTPSAEAAGFLARNISENQLRTEPTDELIRRINAAGGHPALGVLDFDNAAHRQAVEGVIAEAQNRFRVRLQSMQEVFGNETVERTFSNNYTSLERTTVQGQIDQLNQSLTQLRQLESEIQNHARIDRVAEQAVTQGGREFVQQYRTIGDWHTVLTAAGFNDLDPAHLHAMSPHQILDAINRAHAVDATIGWPDTHNTDLTDAEMRLVTMARAESAARARGGALIETNNPETTQLLGLNIRESELRSESPSDIIKLINQRNPGSNWQDDAPTRRHVQEAIRQAKTRVDLRSRELQGSVVMAARAGGPLENADRALFRTSSDYQNAERNLNLQLRRLGVNSVADVQKNIRTLEGQIRSLRELQDISPQLNQALGRLNDYDNALRGLQRVRDQAARTLNGATTTRQLDAAITDRTRVTDDQLREMRQNLMDAQERMTERPGTKATEYVALVTEMRGSFDAMLALGPPLDPDALRTMSVRDIVKLVNRAHRISGGAVGWPRSENERPERRMTVVNAMAEARAHAAEPSFDAPGGMFTGLRAVGFNENQMLTMNLEQVNAECVARGLPVLYNPADPADRAEYMAMQAEVQRRLTARQEALRDTVKANTDRTQEIDKEMKEPNATLERQADELRFTRDMLKAQDRHMESMRKVVRRAGEIGNVNPITPDVEQNFTAAERRANLPQGAYRLYDLIFDYQNNADRDKQFARLMRLMPPRDLVQHMYDAVPALRQPVIGGPELPLAAGSAGVQEMLERLRDSIPGRVNAPELRRAMAQVINYHHARSLARAA